MVAILPPLRSAFDTTCNVPAPNVSPDTRVAATLPQLAPHNPHSKHPINTTDGCYNNPSVIPGYSPSKRYQPYPQPQLLPPGQVLVFGQRESKKQCGPQSQLVDPLLDGGAVQRSAVYAPHLVHEVGVMVVSDLIPQAAGNYDVEMREETYVQEIDLVDVEMEDDFLSPVPVIIVTPPDDSDEQPSTFD